MDETLPVNIAEGAGARNVAWHVERAAHVASVQLGDYTGKISSTHSSPTQVCLRVVEGLEMSSCTPANDCTRPGDGGAGLCESTLKDTHRTRSTPMRSL